MFQFENVTFVYYLPVVIAAILGLGYILLQRKAKAQDTFAESHLFARMLNNQSEGNGLGKLTLFALIITFLFIGLANPQWGGKMQRLKSKSSDIIIALDISQSMMAQDILPNRMERAKKFAEGLIESLKSERIGLISFAGNAYLQMPLTSDYAAAEIFVKSANPSQAGTQGTAIADAIDLAQTLYTDDGPYQKALIIISDGENHDAEAIEAAKKAAENGTFIFTVGVGTEEGSPIPVMVNGRQQYKADRDGNPVRSALNKQMIIDLAEAGGGKSWFLNQTNFIADEIKEAMSKIEKKEVQAASFTEFESYFQYFLAIAIFLFVIYFTNRVRKLA